MDENQIWKILHTLQVEHISTLRELNRVQEELNDAQEEIKSLLKKLLILTMKIKNCEN